MTGFDLLALRARCSANLRSRRRRVKRSRPEGRNLRTIVGGDGVTERVVATSKAGARDVPRRRRNEPQASASAESCRRTTISACVAPSCTRRPARRSRSPCCSRCSEWGTTRRSSPTGRRSCSASCRAPRSFCPISSSGHLILVPWLFEWDVPRGERRLQPDVRRLAAPRDARRGRRLLLGRSHGTRRRLARDAASSLDLDAGRADRVGRRRGDDPGGTGRRRARGRDRGQSRRAVADRDLPRRVRPPARVGRSAAGDAGSSAT